jgi:hypothetical protein
MSHPKKAHSKEAHKEKMEKKHEKHEMHEHKKKPTAAHKKK